MDTPIERVSLVELNSFPRGPSSYPTHCWLYQLQSEKQSKVNGAQRSEELGSVTVYPPRRQVLSTNVTRVVFVGCSQGWGLGKGWVTVNRVINPRWAENWKNHMSQNPLQPECRHGSSFSPTRTGRKRAGVTHRDPASRCALAKMAWLWRSFPEALGLSGEPGQRVFPARTVPPCGLALLLAPQHPSLTLGPSQKFREPPN